MSDKPQPAGKSQSKESQETVDANTNASKTPNVSRLPEIPDIHDSDFPFRAERRRPFRTGERPPVPIADQRTVKVSPSIENGLYGEPKTKLNPLQSFLWALGINPHK